MNLSRFLADARRYSKVALILTAIGGPVLAFMFLGQLLPAWYVLRVGLLIGFILYLLWLIAGFQLRSQILVLAGIIPFLFLFYVVVLTFMNRTLGGEDTAPILPVILCVFASFLPLPFHTRLRSRQAFRPLTAAIFRSESAGAFLHARLSDPQTNRYLHLFEPGTAGDGTPVLKPRPTTSPGARALRVEITQSRSPDVLVIDTATLRLFGWRRSRETILIRNHGHWAEVALTVRMRFSFFALLYLWLTGHVHDYLRTMLAWIDDQPPDTAFAGWVATQLARAEEHEARIAPRADA